MAIDRAASPEFERLLGYLEQTRGFDATAYPRATLAPRIDTRLAAVGVESYDDYVDYLEVHPDEFVALFNAILINVTTFFRDPETFAHLREHVIPAILKGKPRDEAVRVWSAGCASGQECYSIAMLLAEALGPDGYRARVKIYATDVDEEELAQARQGAYSETEMADVPEDLRRRYFDHTGEQWTFRKDFRRNVIFGRHDLLDDAPISKLDLLVCRNTLLYFNQEAQSKIETRFHVALRDGGYLVLGRAEVLLDSAGVFVPGDETSRVFVKTTDRSGHERRPVGALAGAEEPGAPLAARLREIGFEQASAAQIVVGVGGRLVVANHRARALFGSTPGDSGQALTARVTPLLDAAGTPLGSLIALTERGR